MTKSQAQYETLENHIVILGWSERVERVIRELRTDIHRSSGDLNPILIVVPSSEQPIEVQHERVYFIYGRINDPLVLMRANLDKAKALLIPTALKETSISDGESVFSLLAALTVNPNIRACVEIASMNNGETLQHIRSNNLRHGDIEIVSFESLADRLLAQSAINPGITRVYDQLLSFEGEGNEIFVLPVPADWHGRTYRKLSAQCFESEMIIIGYESGDKLFVNPRDRDYPFQPGDLVWFIAHDKAIGIEAMAIK